MTPLPKALAAWAPLLEGLPDGLTATLAPWLGRLAQAVGPQVDHRAQPADEPDGYAGLTRRGAYERLLMSEWAIAEAFPDEFTRRAATGEHLFVDLVRRQPSGRRWMIALCSAGPGQLGAPRLAHVAMLLVLARRARAAGVELSWGILEDRELKLRDDVSIAGISALVRARTLTDHPDAVTRWRGALADAETELWWIGDADAVAPARAAGDACVTVREPLDLARRHLVVEVAQRRAVRRVELELPPGKACADVLTLRALDDPRRHRPGRVVGVRCTGARVVLTLADGTLENWPVPNSPRAPIGKPRLRQLPAGEQLVALAARQRVVDAITYRPASDRYRLDDYHELAVPAGTPTPPADGPPGRCGLVEGTQLIVQLGDRLLTAPWPPVSTARGVQLVPLAREVGFASIAPVGASWVRTTASGLALWRYRKGTAEQVHHVELDRADAAVELCGGPTPRGTLPALAITVGDRCTLFHESIGAYTLTVDGPVVGAAVLDGRPAALVLVRGRRLLWQLPDRQVLLPASAEDVVLVAAGDSPYLACLTVSGQVIVREAARGEELLRITHGAAP